MVSIRHRGVVGRCRQIWRTFAVQVRRVVMLEDTPERIARGCGAGMFFAFPPMLGQVFAGMALAWLIRGNVLAAAPWSFLTNPLTTVPIWYGCYRLGACVLPGYEVVTWERLQAVYEQLASMGFGEAVTHGIEVLGSLFMPMLLGSVMIGLPAGIATWWAVRRLVCAIQRRRLERAAAWRTRLATPRPDATT